MDRRNDHTLPPGYTLERQWILDRLETLSVKEQAQLTALHLSTGRLRELSGKDGKELELAVVGMRPEAAVDAINCLLSLSDYEVLCPAGSYEQLGAYYLRHEAGLPEPLIPYADLEQIGWNYEDNHLGIFVGDCYVVLPGREPRQVYDGTNLDRLPDTDWSLRLKLASPAVPEGVWLCLPDSTIDEEGRMDEIRLALRELKARSVQECSLLEVRCSLPELSVGLDEYQNLTDLIYDGNDLGYVLQEQGQGEPRFLEKFRAALEYEQCHGLKLALDIAQNLNCYDYCPAAEVERLGREALGRQGDALGHDPILMGNIDLCSFGEALLERDGYVLNAAGDAWLRRSGQEFRHERAETQPDQGMTMM